MDTTKLTLFSLISKGIALKILTLLFLVCNIQGKSILAFCHALSKLAMNVGRNLRISNVI